MTGEWVEEIATEAGIALAFILVYAVLFLLAKWLKDMLTPYQLTFELVKKDNFAIGITLGGYFLATAIIFIGVLRGPENGLFEDLVAVGGYSLLGIGFLNISRLILDKVMFRKFCNITAIVEDQNCGMGAVRFGVYVATGLIAAGSLSGQGGGVLTAIAFFVLGQACLVLFAWIYDVITPYDLQHEVKTGNISAGIAFGGTLIALGIVIMNAAAGSFVSWSYNLLLFAELAVVGIVFLLVLRFAMDKLVITGDDLNREIAEDRNMAAGFIEMTVAISFSAVLAALL